MNDDPPKLQAKSTIWKKIRRLDLPNETKAKLRDLWHQAKMLCQKIVEWLYHKRHLASAVLLGVACAYLLNFFPIVGPLLADLAISISVIFGIGHQLKADMDRFFSTVVPA